MTALLNPDVELLDASLAAAGREALGGPERLLAPLVLRADGSREDNAQREPGSAPLLLHALVPGRLLPSRIAETLEPWRARRPRRAGWPVASCLVARTETLRRLGPFDERVFLYAEDLDLGLRAADAGVETWFWPAARVLHSGAHASGPAFGGEPFELLARRRREVVRERRRRRACPPRRPAAAAHIRGPAAPEAAGEAPGRARAPPARRPAPGTARGRPLSAPVAIDARAAVRAKPAGSSASPGRWPGAFPPSGPAATS